MQHILLGQPRSWRALATLDLVQHHGRVFTSVLDDLTQRLFDRASRAVVQRILTSCVSAAAIPYCAP